MTTDDLFHQVLRRIGRLDEAAARVRQVAHAARALDLGVPLHRVGFNVAQIQFAALEYAHAIASLRPLSALESDYTAKAMSLWHLGAALAVEGDCDGARACFRAVGARAVESGGKLDAQLWQRCQLWLARDDSVLPLCALEVHYQTEYFRGNQTAPVHLRRFAAHAAAILGPALASSSDEVRRTALMLQAVIAVAAARALAQDGSVVLGATGEGEGVVLAGSTGSRQQGRPLCQPERGLLLLQPAVLRA